MSEASTFDRIVELAAQQKILISEHGYEKAEKKGIVIDELIATLTDADLIEDYLDAWKGSSILVRHDIDGAIVHAVWGIPRGLNEPAFLITCYKPDLSKWNKDFRKRKK